MATMIQPKKNNTIDFIIVGQGIAGSVLSLSLISAGYAVLVISTPNLSTSSKIAAGIWNPIVFKRLTKSWLADDLVPELQAFYGFWGKELNTTLIHKRSIIKAFTEEQEKKLWIKKSIEGNLFLDKHTYEDLAIDENYTVKSYSKVLQAGNLDVANFIETTKTYLENNQSYREEIFDYHKLKVTENEVNYNSLSASNIIFCDGHLITQNPYFNWIPMKPAKGEVLTIRSTAIKLKQDILNKGFFIMPLGDDLYKVGATYEWEQLNDIPTEKGKDELLKKLNSVLTSPYQIVSHDAGVRPSVIDRRPVVGHHPEYKNLYIFNGLGTKAVMLAPYFAKQLVSNIQNEMPIDEEVNPNRFRK
jgi:glycine oxidase